MKHLLERFTSNLYLNVVIVTTGTYAVVSCSFIMNSVVLN